MTLITRCPACGTLFKVVPDQLRISQGWVRCGQCEEVFDASNDLRQSELGPLPDEPSPAAPRPFEVAAEPPQMADAQPAAAPVLALPALQPSPWLWSPSAPIQIPAAHQEPATETAVAADAGAGAAMEETDPAVEPIESVLSTGANVDEPLGEVSFEPNGTAHAVDEEPADGAGLSQAESQLQADAAVPAALAEPAGEPQHEGEGEREADEPGDAIENPLGRPHDGVVAEPLADAANGSVPPLPRALSIPLPERPTADLPAEPVPLPLPAGDALHRQLSFIRNARPAEPRWRSSLRRALWVFAGVASFVALLLQVVLNERDPIAAQAPAATPWLQALCAPLKCTVQPLRQIESIVIDGSSFSALRNDGYRLSFTLRNRAGHLLALPAIELSLTDIQEQPVVRRVLLPSEIGTSAASLAAHGEWSTSIDLSLADAAAKSRVVGYRLLAFYP